MALDEENGYGSRTSACSCRRRRRCIEEEPAISTPGHYLSDLVIIGDVVLLHRGLGGVITGGLVRVQIDAPLDIAILTTQWPSDVAPGDRVWVKGLLRTERLAHRRSTHVIEATHPIELVRRRRQQPA